MKPFPILFPLLLALAGCKDVNESLSECLELAEPTILLRQLTLAESGRRELQVCKETGGSDDYCNATYINAEVPVRSCMSRRGYYYTDNHAGRPDCAYDKFREPSCYSPTWRGVVRSFLSW